MRSYGYEFKSSIQSFTHENKIEWKGKQETHSHEGKKVETIK